MRITVNATQHDSDPYKVTPTEALDHYSYSGSYHVGERVTSDDNKSNQARPYLSLIGHHDNLNIIMAMMFWSYASNI